MSGRWTCVGWQWCGRYGCYRPLQYKVASKMRWTPLEAVPIVAVLCRFTQRQEERAEAVAAEYKSLQQQLAQLHRTAAELGSSARLSEAQQQLGHMEATLAAADQEHAARVASILRKLQVMPPLLYPHCCDKHA